MGAQHQGHHWHGHNHIEGLQICKGCSILGDLTVQSESPCQLQQELVKGEARTSSTVTVVYTMGKQEVLQVLQGLVRGALWGVAVVGNATFIKEL